MNPKQFPIIVFVFFTLTLSSQKDILLKSESLLRSSPSGSIVLLDSIWTSIENDSLIADGYRIKAVANWFLGIRKESESLFEEGIQYCASKNLNEKRAQIEAKYGAYNISFANYEKGIELTNLAIEYYNSINDQINIARYLNNRAVAYSRQGNTIQALETFLEIEHIQLEINDTLSLMNLYKNIGDIHFNHKNYEYSKNYYNLCLNYNSSNTKRQRLSCLNGVASIQKVEKKFDEALKLFEDCENLSVELQLPQNQAAALGNQGWILLTQGKYESALQKINEARLIFEKLEDKRGILNVLVNEILINNKLEKYRDAFSLYDSAFKLTQELEDSERKMRLFELKAETFTGLNDFENALIETEKFQKLKDSLQSLEKEKIILELENSAHIIKQESLIELLNRNLDETRSKNFILLIIIALVCLVVFVIYRLGLNFRIKARNSEKEKFSIENEKKVLEKKNDGLISKLSQIEKNKQINEILTSGSIMLLNKEKSVLKFADIVYIKASGDGIEHYCINGKKYHEWKTLKKIISDLPSDLFIRTHRSFVINMTHFKELKNGTILLSNDFEAKVSNTYKSSLLNKIENRFTEK